MNYKFFAGFFFFIAIAAPLSTVHASIVCVGIFCSDPYSGVDQTIQQLQLQNQLNSLQQTQSNQTTDNRLRLQYGYTAYSYCMSKYSYLNHGDQFGIATQFEMAEGCMNSYASAQGAKVQCIQNGQWVPYPYGTVGYPGGQCQCNTGYTLSNGVCLSVNQTCQNQYGSNSYGSTDGNYCYCSSGFNWNSGKTYCVRQVCPANATYNSQTGSCDCSIPNQWNSSNAATATACLSPFDQRALSALHPISTQTPTVTQTCTANATYNGSQCICNQGYRMYPGTGCVRALSDEYVQYCETNYGPHSGWNGLMNTQGGPVCSCFTSYEWNTSHTACVAKPSKTSAKATSQTTKNDSESTSVLNGVTNVVAQTSNSTSTEAPTTPVASQNGFWSRLLHIINPFSWF